MESPLVADTDGRVIHNAGADVFWEEVENDFHPGCLIGELHVSTKTLTKLEQDANIVHRNGRVYLACPDHSEKLS